jgi:putative PIN family toxin of toxin-antitoxin system
MQRIVIDTNVIISSLIQKSYPYTIVNELFIDDKIEMCVSEELMAEYYNVLRREKFARFHDFFSRAEALLAEIETKATMFKPKIRLKLISDADDNMVLELADECIADFIITGNTTDFIFPTYKETRIVTPREYWEIYKPN